MRVRESSTTLEREMEKADPHQTECEHHETRSSRMLFCQRPGLRLVGRYQQHQKQRRELEHGPVRLTPGNQGRDR